MVHAGKKIAAGVGDADLFLWAVNLGEERDDAADAEDVPCAGHWLPGGGG
jgi:hypothetical protein